MLSASQLIVVLAALAVGATVLAGAIGYGLARQSDQRLWAEQSTGLLLRADVLGAHGEVIESASFSDVVIGGKPNPDSVRHSMRQLEGYRIVRPAARRSTLDAEGWSVAHPVPGFQLVGCMRRELGVLEVLMLRSGRVVNKEQMAEQLYGWDEEVGANAIEVYVHRLRKKLEPAGVTIRTIRGLGYLLEKPGHD